MGDDVAKTSASEDGGEAVSMPEGGELGGALGGHSAPASPRLPRVTGHNPESKIPRPTSLTSPLPLRRSGSLRLRGEKHLRMGGALGGPGRGGFASSPCTSITEGAEAWKQSLRGREMERGFGPGGDGFALPPLRQQRHHRSLQSLVSTPGRPSSVDSYPHTPTPSPEELELSRSHNFNRFLLDHSKEFCGDRDQEDLDSLRSYGSNCSTQSACDHAHFGRNGTTFSGRRMKYIVHCSSHTEPEEYRTPTQRASQQIRRLKALLDQSRKDLEQKDENIFKLTKEVVELRLLRDEADGSGAKGAASSVEVTPRLALNGEFSSVDRVTNPSESDFGTPASLSDSGHYDDLLSTTSALSQYSPGPRRISSNESEKLAESYQRRIDDMARRQNEKSIEDRKSLIDMYEKKMEEMSRRFNEKEKSEKKLLVETYEMKIENIIKQQKDTTEEQRAFNEESQRKVDLLLKKFETEKQLLITMHEKTISDLDRKHENSYQNCKDAHFDEISSLNIQLQDAINRCSDLQQDLFQARERIVELEEEVEVLQTTLKQQKVAQDEFEEKVLDKYSEEQKNADLHREQSLQEQSQLESEIRGLKDSIRVLEQNIQEAERWKKEAADRSSIVEALEVEVKTLNNQLEIAKESQIQFKSQIELIKTQLLEQEHIHKMSVSKVEHDCESTLASMQRSLTDSMQQTAQLEKECQELQRRLESSIGLQNEIDSYKNLFTAKQEQFEKTNAEVIILKAEVDSLKENILQKDQELNINTQELCHSQNEVLLLMKRISECEEKSQELVILNGQFKQDEEDIEELKSEIEDLRKLLPEEKEKHKKSIVKLEEANAKIFSLENEVASLRQCINEKDLELISNVHRSHQLEREVDSLEALKESKTFAEQKHMECKAKLEEANEKVICLESKLDTLQQCLIKKEQELVSNVQKSCQHQEELSSLRKVVSDVGQDCKDQNASEERLKDKHILLKELQPEIEALRQLVTHGKEQLEESDKKVSYLKAEISSLEQHVIEKDQELLANSEKSRELEEESSFLKQKIIDLEQAYAKLLVIKEKLENEHLLLKPTAENLKLHPQIDSHVEREGQPLSENAMNDLQRVYQDLLLERHMTASLKKELESLKQSACTKHHDHPQEEILGPEKAVLKQDSEVEKETNQIDEVAWLQAEVESLKRAILEQEERHNEINLKMYLKGQEAAKFERKDEVLEMAAHSPEKVSVPELLTQLAETEKELEKVKVMYRRLAESQANNGTSPEATLLFLKSAFYYFLTDEANCQKHLHAIQSILGFTESEKQTVDTHTYFRR